MQVGAADLRCVGRRAIGLGVGLLIVASGLGPTSWLSRAGAAPADTGAGISAAPVSMNEPVPAGTSHELGLITVVNTGTEDADIHVRIGPDSREETLDVPPSWITFDRTTVPLGAGDGHTIALSLAVPSDAATGSYQALVFAGVAPTSTGTGSQIGAEAATDLSFTVTDPVTGADSAFVERLGLGAAGILVVGVIAVVLLRRRRPQYSPKHLDTGRGGGAGGK